jgi:F-type H+-transporting ATPase subunit b
MTGPMPKLLKLMTAAAALAAADPALAATGTFFSLHNTNFVVTLAFVLFVGILLYYRVPGLVAGVLDKRAAAIRADLDEAKALREEAQTILASYERKHREVAEQSERIIRTAREEAAAAAEQAKADLKAAIARRLQSAEDQIASAEEAAVREVRHRAVAIAVAAAGDVIARKMPAAEADALIDRAIDQVQAKLH